LTSGLAKLAATGWNVDVLDVMERDSVHQYLMQKFGTKKELVATRTMVWSLDDKKRYIESMNPARARVGEEPQKRKTKRTARNGGTPVREAYETHETRIVGEAELVPLLN
jgi:hypothetical protein